MHIPNDNVSSAPCPVERLALAFSHGYRKKRRFWKGKREREAYRAVPHILREQQYSRRLMHIRIPYAEPKTTKCTLFSPWISNGKFVSRSERGIQYLPKRILIKPYPTIRTLNVVHHRTGDDYLGRPDVFVYRGDHQVVVSTLRSRLGYRSWEYRSWE